MADSIRELIIQKLLLRLQTITVANGYETGLGSSLTRATRAISESSLPAGSVWAGNEESERRYKVPTQTMEFTVEAFNNASITTSDVVVNKLIADIRKAIETRDAAIDALVSNLTYRGAAPDYPEDGGDIVSVKVTFDIEYPTVKGDPYTQPS